MYIKGKRAVNFWRFCDSPILSGFKDRIEIKLLFELGFRIRQIMKIRFLVLLPSFDINLSIITKSYY